MRAFRNESRRRRRGVASSRPRALPAVGVIAVAVLGASSLVPDLGHQVELSFTRVEDSFVELYVDDVDAARACVVSAGRLDLDFVIASHLSAPSSLRWEADVVTASGARRSEDTGVVSATPGATTVVSLRLSVPPTGVYDVNIGLVGRPEHLSLQCGVR